LRLDTNVTPYPTAVLGTVEFVAAPPHEESSIAKAARHPKDRMSKT
jgi:hypothetical protein